jgi:hypothetical protein
MIRLLLLVGLLSGLAPVAQAFYNPTAGRWLSRDPIAERGGANLYGVADNNPANRFDVLGLQALPVPVPPTFPPIVILPPPEVPPGKIIPFPGPRPIGPPQAALCILVFAGTYYVTYEIADATGIHDGLGDLIGDIIAAPLIGAATGTHPGSPFPGGSHDPLTLPRVNPGPCGKCGNGCKPCPPNSPAWEVNEPGHVSSTTHWHWIEYHQLPATYNKPGSKNRPCDCIPMRQSSPTKPPGA